MVTCQSSELGWVATDFLLLGRGSVTFLSTGSPLHIISLVLFPFSLKEKTKIWFHSLTPNSISNWEDMSSVFLNKFFPLGRTNALMWAIQNFFEKPGESFSTVWERYKEILWFGY